MTFDEKRIQNNYRAMLKRNHFCRDCLKQDAYTLTGRTYCAECAERHKIQHRSARDNDIYHKDSKRHKDLRDKRRAEHKCVRCGIQLEPQEKHVNCATCRSKYNLEQRRHREKFGVNFPRGENGICWQCNKNPTLQGKNLCEKCYARILKIQHFFKPINHPWIKIYLGVNHELFCI